MRAIYSSSAVLLVAYLGACSHATDDGYTLLFLGRSPAARVGRLSWAPDAPHSRLIAFDGDLHVVRTIANLRLSSPAAVAPYPKGRLLVTERTGEGVVWDTAGNPVREWESPFPASLYAADGNRIVAARSPYFVQLIAEDGSAPLLRVLDTLGRPQHGLGTIRVPDPDRLLAQTPTMGRDLFSPAFALPDLSGKTVRLDDFRGKVTLVNFWASWCAPCREEFPHMAELYRDFAKRPFAIAAISDDVSDTKMRAFVREFRPPFPVLVGEARMKAVYHYRGLPYSVLLDRNGRVIERIFGFGGDQECSRLRATIARELDADSTARPQRTNACCRRLARLPTRCRRGDSVNGYRNLP